MPIVSFVNMKGGVAKTTLATNVADALVRRFDKSVLLIDLDPQFNATQCTVDGDDYVAWRNKGGHTILNVFDDNPASALSLASGTKAVAATKLSDIKLMPLKEGLDLLVGDLELHRLDVGGGNGREQRLRRFLEAIKAEERYDCVIIDTPPTPSAWMMSGLLASTHYIVPVKPEPLSRTGIDLLRSVIQRVSENHGHPLECLGVVLTIAEENTIVYRETKTFLDTSALWKGRRFPDALPKRTAIARAQGNQNMILDIDDSLAKSALVKITAEFCKRLSI